MAGRDCIRFSWLLDGRDGQAAYDWHRRFAEADNHILPRPGPEFQALVDAGQVVQAKSGRDIVALAYYRHDGADWEIGGLMVADSERGAGIGLVIARIALGHLLFDEEPFAAGGTIISHVHAENRAPRGLLTNGLKFKHRKSVTIPGSRLPGLKTDANGNIRGDELEIDLPVALSELARWCDAWNDQLRNGRCATINLGKVFTMRHWADAFRDMADRYSELPAHAAP